MQIALQYILTLQPQWQTSIFYILIASISRECKPSIPYDIYEHILYVLYCIVMGMKYSCPISNLCALGTVLCIFWDLQLNTFTPPRVNPSTAPIHCRGDCHSTYPYRRVRPRNL